MDLQYLIENLDKILIYFVPASVFMASYQIIVRYSDDVKIFSAGSVVLSYVMTTIIRAVWPAASTQAILAIAFIAGAIFALIKNSRVTETFFKKKLQKVYWGNVWYGITDYEHGTYLHVYVDGTDISYRGAFRDDYKDDEGHTWIVLSNYRMFKGFDDNGDNGDGLITLEDYRQDDTKRVAIDTTKVSRVSMRYSKDSVKII